MYIGKLNIIDEPKFFHANTRLPYSASKTDSGYLLPASTLYDTEVDAVYTLDKEYYIGQIVLKNIERAANVGVMVDGVKVEVKDVSKPVFVSLAGSEITVRLTGDVLNLGFGGIEVYGFCPDDDEPLLLPTPKSFRMKKGRVLIGNILAEGEDSVFVKNFILTSLDERYKRLPNGSGISLTIELCPDYENERYTVSVTESGATVKAASRLALLWGACKIIELWEESDLPIVEIDDKPDVPMRGFHMGLPKKDQIDFVKRLARYVLVPYGYNHVILEFNGDMRYDTHPEITEYWVETEKLAKEGKCERVMHADIGADGTALEKDEVRDLVDYFYSLGLEVIPEVQSLAHIEYITGAHPEFAELGKCKDSLSEEELKKIQHTNIDGHCYCPSDERVMALIFDLIDEVVEVVRPKRYVHIGHDEVYHLGLCSECRKKGAPRVYIEHVKALYDHLKAKGLGTMLWSDMFHINMYYTDESFACVKEELPKDLMLLDFTWYFHPEVDIEDELLPSGYNIMMGNFYSSHYTRFSKRIKKDGMVGGEVSTWTAVNEERFAKNGKFLDLPYSGEMLWNAYSYDEKNRPSLTTLIGQLVIPELRDLMHGRYDLYLETDIDEADYIGGFDGSFQRIPEELGYLELTEPTEKLKVGKRYDRLIFNHATLNRAPRICWRELIPVGKYTVVYKDGQKVDVPVEYAAGIMQINESFGLPKPQIYYRHQGYVGTWFADPTYEYRTPEGRPILLLGQIWDNPHPEKKIAYITYTPDEEDTAILLSAGVLGVK